MKLFGLLVGCSSAFLAENAALVSQVENQLKDIEDLLPPPEITACVKHFFRQCKKCAEEVQLSHPSCLEDNPYYAPVLCAIKINQCLVENLTGILDCPNNPPEIAE